MYLGLTPIQNAGFATAGFGVTTLVSTGLMASGVGAPVGGAMLLGQQILNGLNIGEGHREADAIVPAQNAIGESLEEINRGIPTASILQLQAWVDELIATAREFRAFVTDPRFVDGRASQQALETLMPLIDGTGADGEPCSVNKWGDPCNGGTLGSVQRRLLEFGVNYSGSPQPTYSGGAGPTLQYQMPGLPYLPQSGFLPPTSPLSPIRSAGVVSVGAGGLDTILPFAILGGLALIFLKRQK